LSLTTCRIEFAVLRSFNEGTAVNRSPFVFATLVFQSISAAAAQAPPRLTFQAFSDVNYIATDRRGVAEGFTEGQLSAHTVVGLTDRLAFYGEGTVSAQTTGFRLDIQRTILRYDFSNAFKLSAGRFHTPISYWNTSYHHGPWLQTTAQRPQIAKFGNALVPAHFVGAMAEGTFSGTLGLGYAVGIGNGRQTTFSAAGDAGDGNRHRAVTGSLRIRPEALLGLQVGGSYYRDRVPTTGNVEFREQIWSAHAAWASETPEVIAEYSRVGHEPLSPGGEQVWSNGYYLQVAARVPGLAALKPYSRFEKVTAAAGDALLAPFKLNYDGLIVGMRYDFNPYAALKGEYRSEQFQDLDRRSNTFQVQASFTLSAAAHAMAAH
jgi:hypothetical protein